VTVKRVSYLDQSPPFLLSQSDGFLESREFAPLFHEIRGYPWKKQETKFKRRLGRTPDGKRSPSFSRLRWRLPTQNHDLGTTASKDVTLKPLPIMVKRGESDCQRIDIKKIV
jgi:hypothetical protein